LIARHDVNRDDLVDVVNGWETLLSDFPMSKEALADYARLRGGGLFRAAAALAGVSRDDSITGAGALWALADLARHVSDRETALRAESLARIKGEAARHLPRALRTFGILTRYAERDLAQLPEERPSNGSPRRMVQALGYVAFRR
jgi:15-cis-phytoene synthase